MADVHSQIVRRLEPAGGHLANAGRSDRQLPWLTIPRRSSAARITLVCFHHAGSGASSYRAWMPEIPPWIELALVQLPGREERWAEPPLARVGQVLDGLLPCLETSIGRPFALFGHSMGGLLAYAVARRIEESTSLPLLRHLFISGAPAPGTVNIRRDLDQSDGSLVQHLRSLGGTPEELLKDKGFLDLVLPVLRADSALCSELEALSPREIGVEMTVLHGSHDPVVSRAQAYAWSTLTESGVTWATFNAGHFFVKECRSEVIALVVKKLAAIIL